jgi:hypothetical protein
MGKCKDLDRSAARMEVKRRLKNENTFIATLTNKCKEAKKGR